MNCAPLLRRLAAVLAVGAFLVPAAAAWGPEGHQIIAAIAEERLSKGAKWRWGYLMGKTTPIAAVSVYMDDVRPDRPETATWHYVNIDPRASRFEALRDCPDGDCVTVKIRECAGVVRLALKDKAQLVECMKFLVHMVGDLHQPLHAGYAEDRGGNKIHVDLMGEDASLHHVWDTEILRQMGSYDEGLDVAEIAKSLNASISAEQEKQWRAGTYKDWTWESHQLARDEIYGKLPEGEHKALDDAYLENARGVVELQLMKAGVRLAETLERIWPY